MKDYVLKIECTEDDAAVLLAALLAYRHGKSVVANDLFNIFTVQIQEQNEKMDKNV